MKKPTRKPQVAAAAVSGNKVWSDDWLAPV
jgi:hypothetical protein